MEKVKAAWEWLKLKLLAAYDWFKLKPVRWLILVAVGLLVVFGLSQCSSQKSAPTKFVTSNAGDASGPNTDVKKVTSKARASKPAKAKPTRPQKQPAVKTQPELKRGTEFYDWRPKT